jgi:hypothetical protein
MYNPRRVLKQWGKCDAERQHALKTEFMSHQDDPEIKNDFVTFLARRFGLYTEDQTTAREHEQDRD